MIFDRPVTKKFREKFSLVGMLEIERFLRPHPPAILMQWQRECAFPIHLCAGSIWCAHKTEVMDYLQARSLTRATVSTYELAAYQDRQLIKNGTRPKIYDGIVLRSISDIQELFKIPWPVLKELSLRTDFPISDLYNFEIEADGFRNYLDCFSLTNKAGHFRLGGA